jgi:hypothetical protein
MNPLITRLFPTERMLKFFKAQLAEAEKRTGKQAPPEYAEWFDAMESTLNGQLLTPAELEALEPIAVEAENEALWRVVPTAKVKEVKKEQQAALIEFRDKVQI